MFAQILLVVLVAMLQLSAGNVQLVVVVPAYNCTKYVKPCADSIAHQRKKTFDIIVINDGSTDKTRGHIEDSVKKKRFGKRVKIISHEERLGPTASVLEAIKDLPANAVVVVLEGDDEFENRYALQDIARLFYSDDVWLAYGNHVGPVEHSKTGWNSFPAYQFSDVTLQGKNVRLLPWLSFRFKAFRAGLFRAIHPEHLKDIPVTLDAAYMIPMIEMAANGHLVFTDKPLITYHGEHSKKDFRHFASEQRALFEKICQIPPYDPLQERFQ